ncbi:HNH endonuclease [Nocardioides szechwanensis]|uniref:DUF222 domain-containing protein n=1 Tax=Nocardioides szechwanensis TaxID=1005944 RepID=A0A1H0EAV3_9ACTN|nr:DUF222 domain-containing protein [Nocardioides szechwanensis]GEP34727.1 HNH endonuclease [Nocardioides szechwanensis]SDN79448.1 protein of unknown function [Nocardioides szechwanensis]
MFEVSGASVSQWVSPLADLPRELTDSERIDLIRALEDLKGAAAAAQAVVSVDFDDSQRAAQKERGWPAARLGEGVASQIGLARRESSNKASRLLGLAKILDREMPYTLEQMRTGRLSEWRATILARETACLSVEDRREVDRRLCGPGGTGLDLSDHALGNAARKLAADLDNAAVAARARKAEADRHVTLRPAPDTMTWFSALLSVKDGVAVFAALKAAADTVRAVGDPRSRGQVMADSLVERVAGTSVADPVRVNLDLVMTDRSFFGASEESAHVPGYGPVPADWAHDLLDDAMTAVQVWVRRLYTHPETGQLVGMDSRARHAPAGLADMVRRRDQDLCRTPWCGAPIRATDHVTEWQTSRETSETNSQGLCERCNLAKQAPGWSAYPSPATRDGTDRHTVITSTPTGHTYHSRAPAPLGHLDYNGRTTLGYELIA